MDIKEELSKLTRYNYDIDQNFGEPFATEVANTDGSYLSYDAVEALVDKADAEIERLKNRVNELDFNIQYLQEAQRNGC